MITQWSTIRRFIPNCYYIPFNKFVDDKRKKELDVLFRFDNNVTWVFKTLEKDKGFSENTPKQGKGDSRKFGNNKGISDLKNNKLPREKQYDGNRPLKSFAKVNFRAEKKETPVIKEICLDPAEE